MNYTSDIANKVKDYFLRYLGLIFVSILLTELFGIISWEYWVCAVMYVFVDGVSWNYTTKDLMENYIRDTSTYRKIREGDYFNVYDTYLFEGPTGDFISKVEIGQGYWWTIESPYYKATSLRCYKII